MPSTSGGSKWKSICHRLEDIPTGFSARLLTSTLPFLWVQGLGREGLENEIRRSGSGIIPRKWFRLLLLLKCKTTKIEKSRTHDDFQPVQRPPGSRPKISGMKRCSTCERIRQLWPSMAAAYTKLIFAKAGFISHTAASLSHFSLPRTTVSSCGIALLIFPSYTAPWCLQLASFFPPVSSFLVSIVPTIFLHATIRLYIATATHSEALPANRYLRSLCRSSYRPLHTINVAIATDRSFNDCHTTV